MSDPDGNAASEPRGARGCFILSRPLAAGLALALAALLFLWLLFPW